MKQPDLNILVVDDNKTDRLILKSILKNFLFTKVQEAEDATIASHKIDTAKQMAEKFNLILLDWNMPGGNGLKVLQHVRNEFGRQGVWVIIMTATAEKEVVEAALKGGADDFIVKPLDVEVLKGKIEKLIKREG